MVGKYRGQGWNNGTEQRQLGASPEPMKHQNIRKM